MPTLFTIGFCRRRMVQAATSKSSVSVRVCHFCNLVLTVSTGSSSSFHALVQFQHRSGAQALNGGCPYNSPGSSACNNATSASASDTTRGCRLRHVLAAMLMNKRSGSNATGLLSCALETLSSWFFFEHTELLVETCVGPLALLVRRGQLRGVPCRRHQFASSSLLVPLCSCPFARFTAVLAPCCSTSVDGLEAELEPGISIDT